MKVAGTSLREQPMYARLASLALFVLACILGAVTIDGWTIIRFLGAQRAGVAAGAWRDPVFGHVLPFYFFDLPFYSHILGYLLALAFVATARLLDYRAGMDGTEPDAELP